MPRLDRDGRVVGIIGIARDVTDQRRAESERIRLLTAEQDTRSRTEVAQRRVGFLAEASNMLAGSLDFEATHPRRGHGRRVECALHDSGSGDRHRGL